MTLDVLSVVEPRHRRARAGATGTGGSSTSRHKPSKSGMTHRGRRRAFTRALRNLSLRHARLPLCAHPRTGLPISQRPYSQGEPSLSRTTGSCAGHRSRPETAPSRATRAIRMPARLTSGRLRQVSASLRKTGVSGTAATTMSSAETSNRSAWPSAVVSSGCSGRPGFRTSGPFLHSATMRRPSIVATTSPSPGRECTRMVLSPRRYAPVQAFRPTCGSLTLLPPGASHEAADVEDDGVADLDAGPVDRDAGHGSGGGERQDELGQPQGHLGLRHAVDRQTEVQQNLIPHGFEPCSATCHLVT